MLNLLLCLFGGDILIFLPFLISTFSLHNLLPYGYPTPGVCHNSNMSYCSISFLSILLVWLGGIFFHSSSSIRALALLFCFLLNPLFVFLHVCLVDFSFEFDFIFTLRVYSFLVSVKLTLRLFCLLETWPSTFLLFLVTNINLKHPK